MNSIISQLLLVVKNHKLAVMICHYIWGQKIKFQAEEIITISIAENIIHYFNFVLFTLLLGENRKTIFNFQM